MHGILFIQDLAVILLVAGAVGWLCQRIGLSVVVGFLAAGILVGPGMPYLSLVSDTGGSRHSRRWAWSSSCSRSGCA